MNGHAEVELNRKYKLKLIRGELKVLGLKSGVSAKAVDSRLETKDYNDYSTPKGV